MKRTALITAGLFFLAILAGCEKDNQNIDNEAPTIDINFAGAFPTQCDQLVRGETFVVKVRLADNVELGSFVVDIHNNFDHHSHSTEVDECDLGEMKDPINPFKFTRAYDIPANSTSHETAIEIAVPENVDLGDYHFMITVTDTNGWSKMIGLSVKII